jgi:prepilin signal peptidase PulO-like enzyme (type II secretory pathway)
MTIDANSLCTASCLALGCALHHYHIKCCKALHQTDTDAQFAHTKHHQSITLAISLLSMLLAHWHYAHTTKINELQTLTAMSQTLLHQLLSAILIAIALIDAKTQKIPLHATKLGTLIGLGCNSLGLYCPLKDALLGVLLGFFSLYTLNKCYHHLRKHNGIGLGDCHLLALIGAWTGWQTLCPIVGLASSMNLFVFATLCCLKKADKDTKLPFAPSLGIATLLLCCTKQMPH